MSNGTAYVTRDELDALLDERLGRIEALLIGIAARL
jgi:hypothetical protein